MIGIYTIENLKNGRAYIGQSKDIKQRWISHKALLRHGEHTNNALQEDWNKYGEEAFKFAVLLECEEQELDEKERYTIQSTENTYNYKNVIREERTADKMRIFFETDTDTNKLAQDLASARGLTIKAYLELLIKSDAKRNAEQLESYRSNQNQFKD